MSIQGNPYIIHDSSLVLSLDAANSKSNITASGTLLNNLTSLGGSPTVTNGTTSASLVTLNGVNGYIEILNSITSAVLSPPIATFDIWFNPSSAVLDSRANSLISRGNYNTAGGFFIHFYTYTVSSNAPGIQASFSYSTTTSYSGDTTGVVSLSGFNKWHHISVAVSSSIELYVNGNLRGTTARTTGSIVYGNGAINTGGDTNLILCSALSYAPTLSNGYWEPYKGSFGMMNMWNRRLSSDEILQNYNAVKSRFGL